MTSLRTTRIVLVPLCVEHAASMFSLLSDPKLYEFISAELPASEAALTERDRRLEAGWSSDGAQQWLNWINQTVEDDACVGFVQATIHA